MNRRGGGGMGLTEFQVGNIEQGNADLLRLPHHVLLERIGRGWKGEVFASRNLEHQRVEAVRTFSPGALQGLSGDESEKLRGFREEVGNIGAIEHPLFPRILSCDTCATRAHKRLAYIAVEHCEGKRIAGILPGAGSETAGWEQTIAALKIVGQVARGLAVAHGCGVLHLDIHADAVLILESGEAKLIDLGIAALVIPRRFATWTMPFHARDPEILFCMEPEPEPVPRAQSAPVGAMAEQSPRDPALLPYGTPAVMPPEQWIDRSNVSPAVDIYNLGCVLFQFIAGEPPFRADTVLELAKLHLSEPPLRSSAARRIPKAIHPVLEKALAKVPEDRFASAGEFADALDDLLMKWSSQSRGKLNWLGNWMHRRWRG